MYSARGGAAQGHGRLDGLRVGDVVHAAADAADALGHHRDVVVGEDGLGELLDAAMHHEPAILAAAHHLAFDVEPEMRRLVERGMERPERHHHAAFRRLVERELALLVEAVRHLVPGHVFAQRMHAVGPAVGQHQPFQVAVAHRLDADQVADFALGPVRAGHDVGDAVHLRIVGGQVGEHAAEQVVAVEGEVVRDEELAGVRPVVQADADDVAGIQVAEDVLAQMA